MVHYEFCMGVYSNCGRRIAESTTSITVSTHRRMLKKQLIIVSSIEVHRLKFQRLSKTRGVTGPEKRLILEGMTFIGYSHRNMVVCNVTENDKR